MIGLAGL